MNPIPTTGLLTQETERSEYVLSFAELLGILRRRLWVILLVAFLAAGAVVAYSVFLQPPKYEASVRILIGQKPVAGGPTGSLGGNVQGLQSMAATMAQAVTTTSVAEAAIKEQHLSMTPQTFLRNLSAQQVPNTTFIDVSYKSSNPQRAAQIANAVGKVFSERVSKISPSAGAITAMVWDPATLPTTPVSPKPVRNGILAFALGAIIGILLAFLLEYLDDSWRSPEEVEKVSGVPTFGIIPEFKVAKSKSKG